MAQKSGIDTNAYTQKFPRLKELPFDSDRKRMTTIHQHDPQTLSVCTKGSLSDLLPHCDTIQDNGKVRPLTQADKDAIDAANRKYAALGLRSIATAYREIPQAADKNSSMV
ncbi:cation-transporting ATPase [Lacticaseibacillus rhamnosus MTCC 5462]|nr:cation-transporting ATPase [Lacticaseibacillus rhamnosus MTCC 5462]